jgi:hypothetical protein
LSPHRKALSQLSCLALDFSCRRFGLLAHLLGAAQAGDVSLAVALEAFAAPYITPALGNPTPGTLAGRALRPVQYLMVLRIFDDEHAGLP